MPEERTLVANLVPQVEDSDLQAFINNLKGELQADLEINVNSSNASTGDSASVVQEKEVHDAIVEMVEMQTAVAENIEAIKETSEDIVDTTKEANKPDKEESEERKTWKSRLLESVGGVRENGPKVISKVGAVAGTIGTVIVGAFRMVFDILKKGWDLLLSKSPFLREIMDAFKSVFNLILGPIGTAIGIELIPILKEVYDKVFKGVQAMWQAYEEGGLEAMIEVALDTLWEVMSVYLIPMAEKLSTIVVDILAGFIDKIFGQGSAEMFRDIWELVKWALQKFVRATSHVGESYDTVKEMWGNIGGFWGDLASGDLAGAGSHWVGGVKNMGENLYNQTLGWFMADGGAVPPTSTGTPIIAGEGGEWEFIVPQSKSQSFARQVLGGESTVYNINVYGYTDTDLTDKIVSAIDQRTYMSRAMGGL